MTETTRTITHERDLHRCGACGAPATVSTTDARQAEDGEWSETGPRYGCDAHPVHPMVLFRDGTSRPYMDLAGVTDGD